MIIAVWACTPASPCWRACGASWHPLHANNDNKKHLLMTLLACLRRFVASTTCWITFSSNTSLLSPGGIILEKADSSCACVTCLFIYDLLLLLLIYWSSIIIFAYLFTFCYYLERADRELHLRHLLIYMLFIIIFAYLFTCYYYSEKPESSCACVTCLIIDHLLFFCLFIYLLLLFGIWTGRQ